MKRYSKYFLMIVLAFSYGACKEEFLEFVPEDEATVGSWYRNTKEIRQATATLYGGVWWKVNDQFSWLAGDLLAGDMFHNWTDEGQFFYASFNESNQYIAQGWQGYYNVISFANLIIDDMPTVAKGNGVSQADINKALGEARFVRGYAYFMLAEYWGAVPIIEKPAEKVTSGNLRLPRNTVQSVYEFARRDLVFAAENLPSIEEPGRVTSWAAKGMLAKLHVTLGQRSIGGNSDDQGSIGSDQDFATAAAYAADVVNNIGVVLSSVDYEDMFKIANEHNADVLFAQQCINNGWGTGSSRQARFARSTRITGDDTAWGDGKCVTLSFMENLKANANGGTDKRKRAIFMELGDKYSYVATKNGGYTYNIISRDGEGAQVEGASPLLNNLKKHIVGNADDHGFAITNQDSPFDIYALRLADVYLLLAEAELGNKASISGGAGLNAYNEVRKRAGLAPKSSVSFVDIMNERRVELALEAQAWLDVKRRYYRSPSDALAYLNGQNRTARYYRINSNDALENDPAGYEKVDPKGARTERDKDGKVQYNDENPVSFDKFNNDSKLRLPIPAVEVVANPLLKGEPIEYVFK